MDNEWPNWTTPYGTNVRCQICPRVAFGQSSRQTMITTRSNEATKDHSPDRSDVCGWNEGNGVTGIGIEVGVEVEIEIEVEVEIGIGIGIGIGMWMFGRGLVSW